MPNGTILNGIFVARLHKSNAEDVLERAESDVKGARRRLFMLSALTPASDTDALRSLEIDVEETLEWLEEGVWKRFVAQYLVDNSEECVDELVDLEEHQSEGM